MMTNADRIRLYEAMGWTECQVRLGGVGTHGYPPDRRKFQQKERLPDPETDANDCEALVRWLWTEHKVEAQVSFGEFHSVSWIDGEAWPAPEYFGDDWKRGVCELALKAI